MAAALRSSCAGFGKKRRAAATTPSALLLLAVAGTQLLGACAWSSILDDEPFGPLSLRHTQPMKDTKKIEALEDAQRTLLRSLRSSHNCTFPPQGTQQDLAVCQLHDVVVREGRILYISEDPSSVRLPDVSVDWLAAGNPKRTKEEAEESLLNYYIDIVTPDHLAAQPPLPITIEPEGMFLHFIFYFNYYHVFGEYGPTVHHLECKFWGKCSYDEHDPLRIFLTNAKGIPWYLLAVKSLVSPDFIKFVTHKPVLTLDFPQLKDKLFVVQKALAGWGTECRADHAHCLPWDQHGLVPRDVMLSWRARVAEVLNFKPERQVPLHPVKVLVIDRDYTDRNGRAVLNIRPVVKRMRKRYECHAVQIQLVKLDGLSMSEQALLYNEATVVLWLHGAAMANLIFLPNNASALQIVHRPEPAELFYWVEELVRDLPNKIVLHHITNHDPDRVILKPGWITKNDIFPNLTASERLMIWEQKRCPHPEGHHYRHVCDEFFFKVGAAMELDPQLLFQKLDPVLAGYLTAAAVENGEPPREDLEHHMACGGGGRAQHDGGGGMAPHDRGGGRAQHDRARLKGPAPKERPVHRRPHKIGQQNR